MLITPAFKIRDAYSFRTLGELLAGVHTQWPRDVLGSVDANLPIIWKIIGTTSLSTSGRVMEQYVAKLSDEQLTQVWKVVSCPWCGRPEVHESACPMLAQPGEIETAMAHWRSGYQRRLSYQHPLDDEVAKLITECTRDQRGFFLGPAKRDDPTAYDLGFARASLLFLPDDN